MLVRLMAVSSKKENYNSVALEHLFDVFELDTAFVGEKGIFNKINSETVLQTSAIERIDLNGDGVLIDTKNSRYTFKII